MVRFKDLKTSEEVRAYLLDIINRTLRSDKDACLYHYTNITSVYKIMESGYICLGSTQKMNDYLEGEFIETVDGHHKVYFSCFSRAEENLAMYKMYAPNPNGAMMVFPLSLAQEMINGLPDTGKDKKRVPIVHNYDLTDRTTSACLYWAAVAYKDLHSNTLRINNYKNDAIDNPLEAKELAGFVKLHGWEYEKEVRLIANVSDDLQEDDKIAVRLPKGYIKKMRIITGPGFDKIIHRTKIAKLKRMGAIIHDSEYDALVDLGGSFENDAEKRIHDLEQENEELKNIITAYKDNIGELRDADNNIHRKKYKDLIDKARYILSYNANIYTNVVLDPDEEHNRASRELRSIGVSFEVFAKSLPNEVQGIPSINNLIEVSRQFIGLSNGVYIYKGGDIGRRLDENERRVEIIEKILGM